MAFVLDCKVTIGGKLFKGVNALKIISDMNLLGDTATIKLPKSAVLKSNSEREIVSTINAVKVGDTVKIEAGYNSELSKEFVGFVDKVNDTTPLQIECVDYFYKFKGNITKAWGAKDKANLKMVLEELIKGTGLELGEVADVEISKLVCQNVGIREVLRKLKKDYALTVFFEDNKLIAVHKYKSNLGAVKYRLGWNTIQEQALKEVKADDSKLKIKVNYLDKNRVMKTKEFGDSDGEARTIFLDNDKSIELVAKAELQKYKYNGMEGKFKSFLFPYARPCMTAEIEDFEFDKKGSYNIDRVVTTLGTGGGRREISLGVKL